MLVRFNIIAAIDNNNGIGKNGSIPWKNSDELEFFKKKTIGDGNNAVIMGRKTYESLNMKILPKRTNIVITSQEIDGVITYKTLFEALQSCVPYRKTYIIGGQRLYEEAIKMYGYLCDKIYISNIPGSYDCDVFFPRHLLINVDTMTIFQKGYTLEKIAMEKTHPEQRYLDLLNYIRVKGEIRDDRTNIGTKSIFGAQMEFDIADGFPLLTTKRTWFEGIKKELLFFISGKTDTKILENQGVNIWRGNTSADFLSKNNLPWREGDMGPGYSFQWRHVGAEYKGCDADYKGEGVDQLNELIEGIKNNPFSRRHIISSWDVVNINQMALPPCHCFAQFYVGCENSTPTYLDCCLYQRSGDMFLGVPFNIASYSLLLCIIGNITGLTPRRFIHNIGDAHIYLNHMNQAADQIKRVPYPFPSIKFKRQLSNIDDINCDDIILVDYKSHSKLSAEMAV